MYVFFFYFGTWNQRRTGGRRKSGSHLKLVFGVGSYLILSSLRSGVWSVLSLVAWPRRQSIALLSPALPTTSSTPSRSNATVAVVPIVKKEAAVGEQSLEIWTLSLEVLELWPLKVCLHFLRCTKSLWFSPLLKWQRCLCRALSASKKAFFKTLCRSSSSSRASLHKAVNSCSHQTFSQLFL